jgi:hypothetical protein
MEFIEKRLYHAWNSQNLSTYQVVQPANPIYIYLNGITGFQRSASRWGASQDHVSRIQGHDGAYKNQKLWDGEDHFPGGSHLSKLCVHTAGDQCIG